MELAAIAIAAAVLLVVVAWASRATSQLNKQHFKNKWSDIEKMMQTPDVGPRLAIIDADKLLDQALRKSKVRGSTMGERLKASKGLLKNYQAVWDAHKLRNRLVHEDVKLKKSQANQAIGTFKTALKNLGAL